MMALMCYASFETQKIEQIIFIKMNTCSSGSIGAWLPFKDPDVEEERQLKLLLTRIDVEIEREATTTVPTVWEKERKNLLRILRRSNHEVEKAVINWKEWVIWRHESKIDQITAEDIQYETSAKLAYWRGMDKLNRPCLVITGNFPIFEIEFREAIIVHRTKYVICVRRMMDPTHRRGNGASFKKFVIRMVEEGCQLADEAGQETISIIYDRRGLDYKHIDPVLHNTMRTTFDQLRTFYGPRLGVLYILHANWFFWSFFILILKPSLNLLSSYSHKIQLVQDVRGLLPYFDEDQIFLIDENEDGTTVNPLEEQGNITPQSITFESEPVKHIDKIAR